MKVIVITLMTVFLSLLISMIINPNVIQLRPASNEMIVSAEKYNNEFCAVCRSHLNGVKNNDLFVSVHDIRVNLELATQNLPDYK